MLCAPPTCYLELAPGNADLVPGDVVYTSGLGQHIPPGLLIGQVSRVVVDPDSPGGCALRVEVALAAELRNLRDVFAVVTREPK